MNTPIRPDAGKIRNRNRKRQAWIWLTSIVAWGVTAAYQTHTWSNTGAIDALAAASKSANPSSPSMQLTGSPAIVNNVISILEGQTVTIRVHGSDPATQSYPNSLEVGIFNNGGLYTSSDSGGLPPGWNFNLNPGDPTTGTFSYTPPAGTAAAIPSVPVKFLVKNTYWRNSSTRVVSLHIASGTSATPAAPVPVVRKIGVTKAQWLKNNQLDISGNVTPMPKKKVTGLTVMLNNANTGELIGTATVKAGNYWRFRGVSLSGSNPCVIAAVLDSKSANRSVKGIPAGTCH